MIPASTKTRKTIHVVVADRTIMDCQLLAASIQDIQPSCKVVGCAVKSSETRAIIGERNPHVAVISAQLEDGPMAGFALVRELRDAFPATRAVILLDSIEPRLLMRAFQVGAKGVFSRDRSVQDLCKCIHVIDRGQIWANSNELEVVMDAISRRSHIEPADPNGTRILTNREAEIANLVSEGLRNRQISQKLSLSTHTVKNYLYRVYEKLGISSRVELVAYMLAPEARTPRRAVMPRGRRAAG